MLEKNQVTLRWQGLACSVKDKRLLYQCDGYCKSGQMTAIMGPSGAGKTTLLSLISKKIDSQLTISGHVYANNLQFTSSSFYDFGVFVYQNDLLHETLTVRETLTTISKLRYKDPVQAETRVDEVLKQFELQKCEHVYIGGESLKGISGGQKKRVCIAVQMIGKPSVIILDEPTSGLDSHTAGSVLKLLKRLAKEGCTILFTIHQPSYLLYSLLQRLILLDKGSLIYQGAASSVGTYLKQIGVQPSITSTISDFFMMEISVYKAQKDNYRTPFNHEKYQQLIAPSIESENAKLSKESMGYDTVTFSRSFVACVLILLARQRKIFFRNPSKLLSLIMVVCMGVLMMGCFFAGQILSKQKLTNMGTYMPYNKLNDRFIGVQGIMYISCTELTMIALSVVTLAFPLSRAIFYKQTSSKKYAPLAFFLAKVGVELINAIVFPVLYGVGIYWINGYDKTFTKFISYLFVLIMMFVAGSSVAYFLGSFFKQVKTASAMAPILFLPLMLASGFYNKLNSIPVYISWLQYVSPFRYGLHLLLLNQYQEMMIPTLGGKVYDYREDLAINFSFWENILLVLAMVLIYMTLSFIFLKKLSNQITA